jgi:hypothetical protein
MTGAIDLIALAERVEAASGPDRELDGRIWCALNGNRFVRWVRFDERVTWGEIEGTSRANTCSSGMVFENTGGGKGGQFQQFTSSPAYTASIDEAEKLVPTDCDYDLHRRDGRSGVAYCFRAEDDYKPSVHAATPALALTAACLRARASQVVG